MSVFPIAGMISIISVKQRKSNTMATILIVAYFVVGAVVSGLIWAILIASKRREDKFRQEKRERPDTDLFREPNTKPSRFQ